MVQSFRQHKQHSLTSSTKNFIIVPSLECLTCTVMNVQLGTRMMLSNKSVEGENFICAQLEYNLNLCMYCTCMII